MNTPFTCNFCLIHSPLLETFIPEQYNAMVTSSSVLIEVQPSFLTLDRYTVGIIQALNTISQHLGEVFEPPQGEEVCIDQSKELENGFGISESHISLP